MKDAIKYGDLWLPSVLVAEMKAVRAEDESRSIMPLYLDPYHDVQDLDSLDGSTGRCKNCGGVIGKGKLGAPVGERTAPYYFGFDRLTSMPDPQDPSVKRERHVGVPLRRMVVWYPCPVCRDGSVASTLEQRSGIPNIGELSTELWSIEYREHAEAVYRRVTTEWSNIVPTGSVTFVGDVGTGKTRMAWMLCKVAIDRGISAHWIMASEMADRLQAAMYNEAELERRSNYYTNVGVLAVDELQMLRRQARSGEISIGLERVFRILDQRVRERRATILTTTTDVWNIQSLADGGWDVQPNHDEAGQLVPILSRFSAGEIGLLLNGDLRPQLQS